MKTQPLPDPARVFAIEADPAEELTIAEADRAGQALIQELQGLLQVSGNLERLAPIERLMVADYLGEPRHTRCAGCRHLLLNMIRKIRGELK